MQEKEGNEKRTDFETGKRRKLHELTIDSYTNGLAVALSEQAW